MSSKTDNISNRALFASVPVPRALASLAIPTIISQLITLIYNLADAFFVGRTGNSYMIAAVSLVYPVFSMTVALSNLFGIGGGSLIARLLGVKKDEEAGRVCMFSIYSSLLVSALFSLLCLMMCDPLLRALGASVDTFGYARQYMLLIIVLGSMPTVVSATMSHLLRNVGYARHASLGLSTGALLNIALDPLFMFVLLPPGNEVIGAALATLISNLVSAVYFLVTIIRLQKSTVLRLSPSVGLPAKANIKSVFYVGLPSAVNVFLYDLSNVCLNMQMAPYGDYEIAALGIVLKAERFPLNTGIGICQGMMPLISYNYSSGDYDRMNTVIRFSRLCGLIVAGCSILMYETCSGLIIRLFISGTAERAAEVSQTVALGIVFLRLRCLASPFSFMNFHLNYSFQAMGSGRITLLLSALRQCIVYIPIMTLMNRLFASYGLVASLCISEIITMCIAFYFYRRSHGHLSGKK